MFLERLIPQTCVATYSLGMLHICDDSVSYDEQDKVLRPICVRGSKPSHMVDDRAEVGRSIQLYLTNTLLVRLQYT